MGRLGQDLLECRRVEELPSAGLGNDAREERYGTRDNGAGHRSTAECAQRAVEPKAKHARTIPANVNRYDACEGSLRCDPDLTDTRFLSGGREARWLIRGKEGRQVRCVKGKQAERE